MLLDRQRSVNIFTSIVLSVASATAYVNMFTQSPNVRLLTLILTLVSSSICLRLTHLAIRVEPISSIYKEWSDQQILLALFQSPNKDEVKKVKVDSMRIEDLPLTHYQFSGVDARGNRQRIAARIMSRFPGSYIIEPKNELDKMKLLSDIKERQTVNKSDKPLIIFADNYDPSIGSLDKLGVYCFVTSNDLNTAITRKVIDRDTAKTLDPNIDITLGLFDGKSIKQLC